MGIDAQRDAVQHHARLLGGTIAKEFKEIESGTHADRPVLARALAEAKREKATLVIARLDRLARNVAFVAAMMEANVDFVCCDTPGATKFTLHIYAAVGEEEARKISERTTAALQAAKRRGALLGSARPGHWEGREEARLLGAKRGNVKSAQVRHENAIEAIRDLIDEIRDRRSSGKSLAEIATALNEAGQRTSRGSEWSPMAVKRALDRAA